MEEYKQCVENYEISNLGNLRKKISDGSYKQINGTIQNRGYKYFQLNRNGKRVNYLFHQLVAKIFIGERVDNLVIDHIDRNKLNNNVENLRYISFAENLRNCDRYREDILEQGRERLNYLSRESYQRNKSPDTKVISKSGDGSIKMRSNGSWRAIIHINKVKYDRTFKTQEECKEYIHNIKNPLP